MHEGIEDRCTTPGMNPYSSSQQKLHASISEMKVVFSESNSDVVVHFYGAGCSEPNKVEMIRNAFLLNGFSKDQLRINHDILGASRALFPDRDGITCILGTGSGSCLFKAGKIEQKVMSLGYILGDEGGGMDIGRRLLFSVLKKKAPENLIELFYREFKLEPQEILDRVYFQEGAKRFIASFTPFVGKHIDHEFCRDIVNTSFRKFIETNLMQYPGAKDLPIGVVGSVGWNFQKIFNENLVEFGFQPAKFLSDPMDGLIKYHSDINAG